MSEQTVPRIIPITNKQIKDITGQRFGRLLVLGYVGSLVEKRPFWLCQCDCGNKIAANGKLLKNGEKKSCGCLQPEIARETGKSNTTHGMTNTSEFRIWSGMLQRCLNPKDKAYPKYGGRGIKVCERWMEFENFIHDVGPRPSLAYSLDRKDNDGDYCPENCRWATNKEQSNNRRTNTLIEYHDQTHTISEWAEKLNLPVSALLLRLNNKWTIERAFTTPLEIHKSKKDASPVRIG